MTKKIENLNRKIRRNIISENIIIFNKNLTGKMEMSEERVSELEEKSTEIIKYLKERKKSFKNKSLRAL